MDFDFTGKTVAELETRKAEIRADVETEGADLDALEAEARAINAEIESRKAAEAQKVEVRKIVAEGAGTVVEDAPKNEVKKMTIEELRSSQAYNEAYKNYIITGKDTEIRKLISENGLDANGTNDAPVPVIVETTVRTAWERNDIMSRVTRTFFRGNFKAYFELTADPAYVHVEGTSAPTEEALTLGVVTMIPANIKKWITISDEAIAMGGEEFLRYIYDELTYRIVKKLSDLCVADVTGASTSSGATAIGVPKVTAP
ncbi:MAG: phage major capsid protein, partial [Lachnospiraceae bacterium]|nr:phage major capsid protein [Lachnospiraceae bacterium]